MSVPALTDRELWPREPLRPVPVSQRDAFVHRWPFWYHRVYLGNGGYTLDATPAFHETAWRLFLPALPPTFAGLSMLDIGCNAGFFALQAKLRGAARVIGTEVETIFLEQADELARMWGFDDIDYRRLDAHDVKTVGQRVDLVVFCGILYHLKNPLQVLEDLGAMCNDAILLETECLIDDPDTRVTVRQGTPAAPTVARTGMMKFIEKAELNGDSSNWWVPDIECVRGMLRTAGFKHLSKPVVLHDCRLLMVASKERTSCVDVEAFGQS